MTQSRFSTRERILGAAESLFAQHGFAGASLRQVTTAAKVNLAAVNYHFGSKDTLIEEVLRRRLDALNAKRVDALEALDEDAALEAILHAFIRPALELSLSGEDGAGFVRVLARAYADHNDRLRRFMSENYGHILKRFAAAFARRLPHLSKDEMYWRLDIVSGAVTYAMTNFGMIKRQPGMSEEAYREQTAAHLVHFAAAGLNAP